jgi:hypothetical protein
MLEAAESVRGHEAARRLQADPPAGHEGGLGDGRGRQQQDEKQKQAMHGDCPRRGPIEARPQPVRTARMRV